VRTYVCCVYCAYRGPKGKMQIVRHPDLRRTTWHARRRSRAARITRDAYEKCFKIPQYRLMLTRVRKIGNDDVRVMGIFVVVSIVFRTLLPTSMRRPKFAIFPPFVRYRCTGSQLRYAVSGVIFVAQSPFVFTESFLFGPIRKTAAEHGVSNVCRVQRVHRC